MSGDGSYTVTYYSVDAAGNTESSQTIAFQIDATAPVTTDRLSGNVPLIFNWYNTPVTVTLSASDYGSSVAATYYAVNGDGYFLYSGPFTVSTNGSDTISYYSIDVAGNQEPVQSDSFLIDTGGADTVVVFRPGTPAVTGGWYTG